MRSIASLAVATVLFCYPCFSQQKLSHAEGELRAAMEQRVNAAKSGDAETLARLVADDYQQMDPTGGRQDKATWLKDDVTPLAALIKAGAFKWEQYELSEVRIQMFGDFAVVFARLDLKGTGAKWVLTQHTWTADPNFTFSGTLYSTYVYAHRNRKWLLVALQHAIPSRPQSAGADVKSDH